MKPTKFFLILAAVAVCLPDSASADLIISEIMYDPASMPDGAFEYVEIWNTGGEPVDLTGYVFDDSAGTLPSANITGGTIPAGGVAVLVPNGTLATMQSMWGAGINFIQVAGNLDLNNTNDKIALWPSFAAYENRNYANALDVVDYYESLAPWPGSGFSAAIYLRAPQLDNNIGTSWSRSLEGVDGAFRSAPAGDNNSSNLGSPGFVHGAAAPRSPCCVPSGGCATLTAADCAAVGGTAGPGASCGPLACPAPQACCLPHGACGDLLPELCAALGGAAGGAGSACATVECAITCGGGGCPGDMDGNHRIDGDDVGPFVTALTVGAECP